MNNMKKCSGCKEELPLSSFYKNKRTNDGHSIYCVTCTKENSRKYHQRKKNRLQKVHSDEVVKNMVINNLISENANAEVLMKLIMTERLLENALTELRSLKLTVSSNQMVSNIN
jgi:type VI protein secretion system component VasA